MEPTLDLYIVLDRSASMSDVADTVVPEVNRLVDSLSAEDPRAEVTVVAFDSTDPFDIVVDRHRPRPGRPAITAEQYRPGGGTPLFDAIGDTLTLASRNLRDGHHRRRVLVAVITDGEDNDSQITALDVLGKIRRRKAAGWEFLYLGVGDVFGDAARIGIDASEVHPWTRSDAGTAAAFATVTSTALHRPARRHHRRHI